MLDIKDKNNNHVDYITADDILDINTFQEKNPQDLIIEKIERLWRKDYISFDQATEHYREAMEKIKTGIPFPFKGYNPDNTEILSPTTYEDYIKYINWMAVTLYSGQNSTPESYEKYSHLYTDEYFGCLMESLTELFETDNILKYIEHFQLFISPQGHAHKERDWFDLQCEHESVHLNNDKTPHEIDMSRVESSTWKHWTPHRYRQYLTDHSQQDNTGFGYHHDPYNFMWIKLSDTKRLMTRNLNRIIDPHSQDDVPIKSSSVIAMDGFMHAPDPSSWGISMRITFLPTFWSTKDRPPGKFNELVEHITSHKFTALYPPDHCPSPLSPDGLVDYGFQEKYKDLLNSKEYQVDNWQNYWWWKEEPAKLLIDKAIKYLENK